MPDITQRIADILRRLDEESTGGDLSSRSSTGPEQWAEVLTTELGLTAEYGVVYEGDYPELPEDITEDRQEAHKAAADKCLSCDRCRNALPKHVEVRYVSKWVPDE